LQFETLDRLSNFHLVEFGRSLKPMFPFVEEQPPLAPVREDLRRGPISPPQPEVQLVQGIAVPRYVFIDFDKTRLIQIQQDRFVHNWRRLAEETYPRYRTIRAAFLRRIRSFRRFLTKQGIGDILANQCELTYVNPIPPGAWERHGQLDRVFTTWRNQYSDEFLSEPQDVRFLERHLIEGEAGEPMGRLLISGDPVYHIPSGEPRLLLQLIARGTPKGVSMEDVMAFFDLGHEWIVRGFTSITTTHMHELWGRER
jgi:uncharacterized protein (TIGR04255 family)